MYDGRTQAVQDEGTRVQAAPALPLAVRELVARTAAHDQSTVEHATRVVRLSRRVGRAMGLDGPKLRHVALVALLHDVGKTAIERRILDKPGPLNEAEWLSVRHHPDAGAQIVTDVPEVAHLAPAIRASHERWDGLGYPVGLAGEAIPVASRISFVCDSFDAMLSDRPYRAAMPLPRALDTIGDEVGRQFCPTAAAALIDVATPPWRVLGRPRI
jgi:HD-GYP domain-containing protein (c-di-GMP phosphodiesterase class II)